MNMELIKTKIIKKESHTLTLNVYVNFLIVKVVMPFELAAKIIEELPYGSWDMERYACREFAQEVFSTEHAKMRFFENSSDFKTEMRRYGLDVEDNNNNDWFISVLFPIDEQNFNIDLENQVDYIRRCSDTFEENSISGKIKIASKILDKL